MNVKLMELKAYSFQVLNQSYRLQSDFISAMNNVLKSDCTKYDYNFIQNSNILPDNLWQNGLHLNKSGKGKLLNNFLVSLNKNYFLSKPFFR